MDVYSVDILYYRLFCHKDIVYFDDSRIGVLVVDVLTNIRNFYISGLFSFSLFHSKINVWKRIENTLYIKNIGNHKENVRSRNGEEGCLRQGIRKETKIEKPRTKSEREISLNRTDNV